MIRRITLDQLSVPLTQPYHLSFDTVTELDLLFVRIQGAGGATGYGEVATLDGYFDVGIETVWTESQSLAESTVGRTVEQATDAVTGADQSLLTQSAFAAAIEGSTAEEVGSVRAPVVGIVSAHNGVERTVANVTEQLDRGHEVIKIKIGFDPAADAASIRAVTRQIPNTVSLRVDANQGYSLAEAREFLNKADVSQIQLFEQPLPVGNLDKHATLREGMSIPLMLDEELSDQDSLRRVISADATDMMKFKQVKQGGPAAVRSLTTAAQEHGIGVVLGNGVQSDVGCLQEAHLWKSLGLDTVGEFNGWHKQDDSLVDPAPVLKDGMFVWDGSSLRPDHQRITALSVRRHVTSE